MARSGPPFICLLLVTMALGLVESAVTNEADTAALVALYTDTNGAAWIGPTCGWTSVAAGADPCCTAGCPNIMWSNINCTTSCGASTARVISVALDSNNLVGTISSAALSLSALLTLDLSNNPVILSIQDVFTGAPHIQSLNLASVQTITGWSASIVFPTSLVMLNVGYNKLGGSVPLGLANLTNIEILVMNGNNFVDALPPIFSSMTRLTCLVLATNIFDSPIPNDICNARALETLDLSGNGLTGTIPSCINNLVNLVRLDLSFNMLTAVPDTLWQLPNLQLMNLEVNYITSPLPTSMANLSSISNFELELNNFYGTIPDLSICPNLSSVILSRNQLTGTIPPSICDSSHTLDYLLLDHNQLSGTVPSCISQLIGLNLISFGGGSLAMDSLDPLCDLSALYSLQLIDLPNFTGTIPACLANTALVQILIHATSISGSIPPALFSLPLTSVVIDSNLVSGPIPEALGRANQTLTELLVPNNRLTGTLPTALTSMALLQSLDVSNNNISGYFPSDWNIYEMQLTHADFHNTAITLLRNETIFLPTFWALTSDCQNKGQLAYLDLSGLNAAGYSLDQVVVAGYSNIGQVAHCTNPLSNELNVLRMSNMGLVRVSGYILALVENLVLLDISDNQISGELPAAFIPSTLVTWDASGNNFSGTIPNIIGDALVTTLEQLNLLDNPLLGFPTSDCPPGENECIPAFLAQDVSEITQFASYYCYGLTDNTRGSASVLVDPQFYNYELCSCNTGFYGNPRYWCNATETLCIEGACVIGAAATDSGPVPVFNHSFYPMPNMTYVTQFLPCRSLAFVADTQCNATQLTCTVVDGNLTCLGNPCSVGRRGLMCSECDTGFYSDGDENCLACPTSWRTISFATYFTAAVSATMLISLICFFSMNTENTPPTARCYHCRTTTSYVVTFNVLAIALIGSNIGAWWEALSVFIMLVCAFGTYALQNANKESEKDWVLPQYLQNTVYPLCVGLLKSQIVFTQMLVPVGGGFYMGTAKHPTPLYTFLAQATLNNPLACYVPELGVYRNQYLYFLADPLIFAGVIGVFLTIGLGILSIREQFWRGPTSRRKFKHAAQAIFTRAFAIVLLYFNLMFFQATSAFMAFFSCTANVSTPSDEHTYYNLLNPATVCFTPSWWSYTYAGIGLYSTYLVVAILVAYRLSTVRRRLHDDSVRNLYGVFYASYHFRYWYYDLVVFVRRVLVGGIAALVVIGTTTQAFWTSTLLMLFGAASIRLVPFRNRIVNLLDGLSISVILVSGMMYCFSILEFSLQQQYLVAPMIVLLLAAYVLVAVVMFAGALRFYCCPTRRPLSWAWEWADYCLAPVHLTSKVEPTSINRSFEETIGERAPLLRRSQQMTEATSGDADIADVARSLPLRSEAVGHLDAAMRLPAGSAERETALLAALKSVTGEGLHHRAARQYKDDEII